MISRRHALLGAGALVTASLVTPAWAEELVVVVHPSNPEMPTRAQLAAMFTTRRQSWNGGARVVPFNFPPKHQVRVDFDKAVLEMSPEEVARYWIDRRIRGGTPPPKSVSSAQLIVRLVSKLEGAVAYVPRSSVEGDVRIVTAL
jgi:hypothetical protein